MCTIMNHGDKKCILLELGEWFSLSAHPTSVYTNNASVFLIRRLLRYLPSSYIYAYNIFNHISGVTNK